MLINVAETEECRVAVVEGGSLEELYVERTSISSHVGNVYKGKVVNIESGIQAAFIDFGIGRNGFLHISDLHPRYFGSSVDDSSETIGRRKALRERIPIQKCLKKGFSPPFPLRNPLKDRNHHPRQPPVQIKRRIPARKI